MKNFKFFVMSLCSIVLITFMSCEVERIENSTSTTSLTSEIDDTTSDCDAMVDFNNLEAGLIVNELSSGNGVSGAVIPGSIIVFGENLDPNRPDVNHAMIFDSDNPTGDDEDLVVPGADHQEILIISEDLDTTDPDDDDVPGGIFIFDFSGFGPGFVEIISFSTIDNEEAGEYEAFNADGVIVASGPIAEISDATDQIIMVNANNVALLTVTLNGSGAVDDFCINVEEQDSGCTYTQGFWKNRKKGPFPDLFDRDDIFFLSDLTWQEVLNTAPKGNAYFQAAHQYIAAVLNVANGASSLEEVDNAISVGNTLFETYTPEDIAPLKGNNELRAQFLMVNDVLDDYNNGIIGPGHCDD